MSPPIGQSGTTNLARRSPAARKGGATLRIRDARYRSLDGVAGGAGFGRSSSAEHRDHAETSRIGAHDRRRGPRGRAAGRGAAREHTARAKLMRTRPRPPPRRRPRPSTHRRRTKPSKHRRRTVPTMRKTAPAASAGANIARRRTRSSSATGVTSRSINYATTFRMRRRRRPKTGSARPARNYERANATPVL